MKKENYQPELSTPAAQTELESPVNTENANWDVVEAILSDLGGAFTKYQIQNYILFSFTFALAGTFVLGYVFTALNLNYRCFIPECEEMDTTSFAPDWLQNAVPYSSEKPASCSRYQSDNFTTECTAVKFNDSRIRRCDQFVYRTNEISILNQFGLQCDENVWKLSMVGTANNVGRFVFTPVMGYMSDRFGRRTILVVGILGSVTFAYIRSFAPNYNTFIILELFDAGVGSATYSASFILTSEWISVKHRTLLVTCMPGASILGQVFLALATRAVQDFRLLLRIIYAPGLLILIYPWVAPESIRWLVVKGHKDRVLKTLSRAERMNGIKLSLKTVDLINRTRAEKDNTPTGGQDRITDVIKKRVFLIRLAVCSFAWITVTFVTYGLSVTSVSLAGDRYVNFMIVALAGVPGTIVCYFMMEWFGRRWTLFSSLLFSGASIVGSKLIPLHLNPIDTNHTVSVDRLNALSISMFFFGKLFIYVALTGIYIYTSELWPTNMRHRIMGLCSTMGRIGAMFAPLTPLLSQYGDILPYLTFAGIALIAAVLILLLPETRNTKLPDSLCEAENIADHGNFNKSETWKYVDEFH